MPADPGSAEYLLRVALVLAVSAAYYLGLKLALTRRTMPAVRRLLRRPGLARRRSADQVEHLGRLALAVPVQLAFLGVLLLASGVGVGDLLPDPFEPLTLLYGLALGVGEGVCASYAAFVAVEAVTALAPASAPATRAEWGTVARGGWMRGFLKTAEGSPWYVALTLSVAYIAVEETIFRGVLITFFLPLGATAAVLLSLLMFYVPQVTDTPSWRTALFPVVGATVVGLVNGVLFVATRDLTPLVVAHCVLVGMTIVFPPPRPAAERTLARRF